ncbi:MAG: YraN family protein [bacterium]
MKSLKQLLGQDAEARASKHLQRNGLRIITQNYHCRGGEIDIIARDNEHLVFVEVRYRSNPRFGSATESVTAAKQQRLARAAKHYLQKNRLDVPCRFDVIGLGPDNQFDWVKNAF